MIKKQIIKFVPHWLLAFYNKYVHGWGTFGDYITWASAEAAASGYDDAPILKSVIEAARKVQRGEAAYERDGVTFETPEYSENLLSIFEKIAAECGGKLSVMDFGGSLGSTFFQYRDTLSKYDTTWCVVEQAHFVTAGKVEFETNHLHFEYDIKTACALYRPNLIFVSSVLQYLEKPYDWLAEFAATEIPYLLIDMQPVTNAKKDKIVVQRVPANIYRASYPCHLLGEQNLMAALQLHYNLIQSFEAWTLQFDNFFYKGYFLKNKYLK